MSDYIDRNVAIDAFCSLADALNSAKAKQPNTLEAIEICGKISGIYLCKGLIRTTKSADVTPIRRGHWIYDCCDIVCSECGTAFSDEVCYMMRGDESYHEPKHCPWCGAEMSEENER